METKERQQGRVRIRKKTSPEKDRLRKKLKKIKALKKTKERKVYSKK